MLKKAAKGPCGGPCLTKPHSFFFVAAGLTSQFDIIYDQQLWDYGYDISSDMQYNEKAFSKDDTSKTMEAKNGQPLGSNSHMDAMDVEKVNRLYDCPYIDCKYILYQKITLLTDLTCPESPLDYVLCEAQIYHSGAPREARRRSPIAKEMW